MRHHAYKASPSSKPTNQTINARSRLQQSSGVKPKELPTEIQSNVQKMKEIPSSKSTQNIRRNASWIRSTWCKVLFGSLIVCAAVGVILGPIIKILVMNAGVSSTDSIATLIFNSTSAATMTTTTSSTTTTVAPASYCITTSPGSFANNVFLYSNSRNYACGLYNYQFGVYVVDSYGNVTSTAIWNATQTSTQPCWLALQVDRNLVVYGSVYVYWAAGVNNGGSGYPFCLQMWDSGNLQWVDNTSSIIWQTHTAMTG